MEKIHENVHAFVFSCKILNMKTRFHLVPTFTHITS